MNKLQLNAYMAYTKILCSCGGGLPGSKRVDDVIECSTDGVYSLVPLQQLLTALLEGQQALHLINTGLRSRVQRM